MKGRATMTEHGWRKIGVREAAAPVASARHHGRVRVIVAGLLLAATMGSAIAMDNAGAAGRQVAARTFHTATFAGTAHPEIVAGGA